MASSTEKKQEPGQPALFVYAGLRMGSKGKRYDCLLPLDGNGEVSPEWQYSGRLFKNLKQTRIVGGVYEIRVGDGGDTIYPGTAKFLRQYDDPDVVSRLRALHEAERRAAEAERGMRRLEEDASLRMALEPVRRAYAGATGVQRTQLLAAVVQYVTQGRS